MVVDRRVVRIVHNTFEYKPVNACRMALSFPFIHLVVLCPQRETFFRRNERSVLTSVVKGWPSFVRLWFFSCVFPAAWNAGADKSRAEHLQHRFPWADSSGQRGLCGERTTAFEAQVIISQPLIPLLIYGRTLPGAALIIADCSLCPCPAKPACHHVIGVGSDARSDIGFPCLVNNQD